MEKYKEHQAQRLLRLVAAIWHVHLKTGIFYRFTLSKEIMLLINSLCEKKSYASEGEGIALKVISSFVLNILVRGWPKSFQPTFHSIILTQ